MHLGSRALAAGADYLLLSPRDTMLPSTKPCVAICAVRTGSGKSQTTARVAELLRESGKKVAVLRHPMPYGDLAKQACSASSATRTSRRRLHDRGARGVRAAPRGGQPRVRRHRLRGDPRAGRARSRRDPVGRRQQRHAVHPARRAHRRRRSAPPGPRASLPPRRDEPAHGRRVRREQDRQRAAGGNRRRARLDPRAQPGRDGRASPRRRSTSRATRPRSTASAFWRSRTGRRSRTAR